MSSLPSIAQDTCRMALAQEFLAAVHTQEPVTGLTHNFYRYPARFSPRFARAAIQMFSQPGDVVLDPFMGGATTLVEARALGRHAVGSDISSLSVFLAQVKTTPLLDRELGQIACWLESLQEHLNLHLPSERAETWQKEGYQRHVPWPIRKTLELALSRVQELRSARQELFARCLLLRVGQWALDWRERIPAAEEFRFKLFEFLDGFIKGMREYRQSVRDNAPPGQSKALTISIRSAAADLAACDAFASLPKKPTLVVASPPYPGVHVRYHRWTIHERVETAAPFWIADCLDGQGAAYYSFGDRKQLGLRSYFEGIRASFSTLRKCLTLDGLVVQIVGFSQPDWQVDRYLEVLEQAGYEECLPWQIGLPLGKRLWREVPGRRGFAASRRDLLTSRELVLFHRPKP